MRRRMLAVVLALAGLAPAGCVHLPCWCDDPEASPRRPGRDGTTSADLGPGARHAAHRPPQET